MDRTTIGQMRKRVTIQQSVNTPDDRGGYTTSWTDVATVWARIEPLNAHEYYRYWQMDVKATHRITIRYRAGITTDMQVLYGSTAYNIRSVIDPDEYHGELVLIAEEGKS